jgi:hypothetical protein
MKWHWYFSCAAAAEIDRIMLGAADYEALTTVRLVRYISPPSGDYVHVTGENTGCWSYVGRLGGVSGTVQGVVKTSPALGTKPLGFRSHNSKHKCIPVHLVLPNPPLQQTVSNLRKILPELLWLTHEPAVSSPTANRGVLTADHDIWCNKYVIVLKTVT